jgi:hypothetical protein
MGKQNHGAAQSDDFRQGERQLDYSTWGRVSPSAAWAARPTLPVGDKPARVDPPHAELQDETPAGLRFTMYGLTVASVVAAVAGLAYAFSQ